jgi:hypothetical protein
MILGRRFIPNPREALENLPSVEPLERKIPQSARTMRVFQPRYATGVAWVDIINGGTGFLDEFPVTFSGTGPGGATGIGRARGGVLQCIAVTAYGNYTGPVTANLSAGGGAGAVTQVYTVDPGAVAESLGITDVVWCYTNGDLTFANSITSRGIRLQGSMNGLVDYPSGNAGAALAYDGQPVPVAWLLPEARAFGASWRTGYLTLKQAEAAALVGVSAVHFDDPAPDLSAIRANDSARSGGPLDSETLAGFRPGYVAELQAVPITQDNFNWTTKTWPTSTGNWLTGNPGTNVSAPNRLGYLAHLRQGIIRFHEALRMSFPSSIRYRSGNTFDPMFRIDYSGYLLRVFDLALFETETPEYSGLTPTDYAQRFTRPWVNIKSCEGARVGCIPHFQVLRNDQTYASTRAMRVAVMKPQIALGYALGANPTYPWDIYLYPWTAGQNERWFAKPSDGFDPLYEFVADYPQLFDGTRAPGALLLACDVDTSDNRAVTNANILGWADVCLRNAVPVIMYPLGGTYSRDLNLEKQVLRVVDCSTPSAVTAALSTLPNYATIGSFPFTRWSEYFTCRLTGTFTDVFPIVRCKQDRLLVHITNFDNTVRSGLSLRVQPHALPGSGFSRLSGTWYAPGASPQTVSVTATPLGLTASLPNVDVWGVLELVKS